MRMRRIAATAVTAMLLWGAVQETAAQETAAQDAVIDEARAQCQAFEDGTFTTTDDVLAQIDLSRDGRPDTLVDGHGFRCTSGNLYCGTGGCPLTVLVDGSRTDLLARGWRVVDWGTLSVLLLDVHGVGCGGTNLRPCVEALVWSEGAFRSVRGN